MAIVDQERMTLNPIWESAGVEFLPPGQDMEGLIEDFYGLLNQLCMLQKLSGERPCVSWYALRGASMRKKLVVVDTCMGFEYPLLWARATLYNEHRLFAPWGLQSMHYTTDKWKGHFPNLA